VGRGISIKIQGTSLKSLLTVDIAHPPLRDAEAVAALDDALRRIRASSSLRVMKIIHGYGALGTPAPLKGVVASWLGANQGKIISFINGEEISVTNPKVQVLLAECDIPASNDFLYPNGEITLVWVS
jgi:hypothetical protein